jgi:hypothetical protein
MFIKPIRHYKNGKNHVYWALVESYRSERGPRQRIVSYLGSLPDKVRRGVLNAATGKQPEKQRRLFSLVPEEEKAEWVEINANGIRLENKRGFGGPWLAMHLIQLLGLDKFLQSTFSDGREKINWSLTALILVINRFLNPSSELFIAEHGYEKTALSDLLGVPVNQVDDNRLYRGLDHLLAKKEELEVFLKNQLGRLFKLEYDILFYDITSTYFEGKMESCPIAKRGYSRDQRPDCKQVVIGLVVTREGMPLGYEVFDGNQADVTSMQGMVGMIESRYGKSDRIWVTDRGMVSDENL